MLYPEDLEQKIGFDQIRNILRENCLSTLGENLVEEMHFTTDAEMVRRRLNEAQQFVALLEESDSFPQNNYIDVTAFFNQVRPAGSYLSEEEFVAVKLSLFTIIDILSFFDDHSASDYPDLYKIREGVETNADFYQAIENVIDDDGEIRDSASKQLAQVRGDLFMKRDEARNELERVQKYIRKEGYISDEELSITFRNGRLVIPINASYKRQVRGYVHGESATGKTVYIEPSQVLEINNEIKDLEIKEKKEEARILTQLTDLFKENETELLFAYSFLAKIDLLLSKRKLMTLINARVPVLTNKRKVSLKKAVHPLLYLSHKKLGRDVVPLSLSFGEENRLIVLSGPNAGGKSVALKTTGLLQYMIQTGLPVPADESSEFGIYDDLFIDIGDEQSIESDLSTYSSHLQNMKAFVENAGDKTLILIDEMGSGTEPYMGGAMAEAILEKLLENGCQGIVTTHFGNLKSFAQEKDGVVNAAMGFDLDRLTPLFTLQPGKPGSSFAFEIAENIGLPDEVVRKAREKAGGAKVEYEELLSQLEKEKQEVDGLKKKLENLRETSEKEKNKYEKEYARLSAERKQIINDAKKQADGVLKAANKRIENVIRTIRESQGDKEKTREAREGLEDFKKSLKTPRKEKPEVQTEPGPVQEGDAVLVKDSGAVGEVINIKGRQAEILIGELKSNVKLSRLQKVKKTTLRKAKAVSSSRPSHGVNLHQRAAGFSPNLDVRGEKAEDVVPLVDRFIDNALMLGFSEVRILHGKGEGVLRSVVREHLKTFNEVHSVEDEHIEHGGAGITVVGLRK